MTITNTMTGDMPEDTSLNTAPPTNTDSGINEAVMNGGANNITNAVPGPQPPIQGQPQNQAQPPVQPQQPQKTQPKDIFHSILSTLAGPQNQYSIDPNTGQMVSTPVKRTTSQLANSIVAGALTGMFSGLGERGPGADLRAAQAGFQAGLQRKQQQDQTAQNQAQGDFARHAQIFETNMRMYQNAQQASRLDYETHKAMTDDATGVYNELKDYPGAIVAEDVPEQDLTKYHATKNNALPMRVVPRIDPQTGEQAKNQFGAPLWDNTYAVVDPNFDINLPEDLHKKAVDMKLPGFVDREGKEIPLPTDARLKARLVVGAMTQIHSMEIFQKNLQDFSKVLDTNESKPNKTVTVPDNIASNIDSAAKANGIDANLFRSLVMKESQGNPNAISPKGAQGLAQLMPATAKSLGVNNPLDVDENLNAGAKYLKQLLDRYDGNTEKALAAYNAGPGAVDNAGGIPNIPETKDYVKSIMSSVNSVGKEEDQKKPIKVSEAAQNDPNLPKAIQAFQKYYDGTSVQKALDAMSKDKSANQYTGNMVQAFGGPASIQAHDNAIEAKQKAGNAEAEAKAKLPIQEQKEKDKEAREQSMNNEWGKYLEEPPNFERNPDSKLMSYDELKQDLTSKGVKLPPDFAGLYAAAHNRAPITTWAQKNYKGTSEEAASKALSYINQFINPNYDTKDYQAAQHLKDELYSTKTGVGGGSAIAAGTAANHLNYLMQIADAMDKDGQTQLQAFNKVKAAYGVQTGAQLPVLFKAIADQVNQEVGKTLAGGSPHQTELDELRKNLNTAQTPEQVHSVIDGYINLMQGRLSELNYRSQDLLGEDLHLSPQVAMVFGSRGSQEVPGYGKPVRVNGQFIGFTQDGGKTLSFKVKQ